MAERYAVILEPDSNGTLQVIVPAIPEAHTFGDNVEHAMLMAREVIEACLAARVDLNEEIPPSDADQARPRYDRDHQPGRIARCTVSQKLPTVSGKQLRIASRASPRRRTKNLRSGSRQRPRSRASGENSAQREDDWR